MLLTFVIWAALWAVDANKGITDSGLGIGIIFVIFMCYFGYALKYCTQTRPPDTQQGLHHHGVQPVQHHVL
jgi:uncharacterized membrane protein